MDSDHLDNISAFARRVGLTPSALRFYDDCAILRPARTDPHTGYRYYSADQEHRAVLLRKLREADVPLTEVGVVLDGPASRAREVLRAHSRRLRTRTDRAQAALDEVLRYLAGEQRADVTIGGAELASAVRQVVPAAARADSEHPELTGVLIDVSDTQVRLVATDRYRLAIRELIPSAAEGGPTRVLVPADALLDLTAWAVRHAELRLVVTDGETRLVTADDARTLPTLDARYPDYRGILSTLEPATHRVLTDRIALREALASADGPHVVIESGTDTLRVGGTTLAAVCSTPLRIAFDPAVLGPIIEASVGPDVLLEATEADRPVFVRSADQGSFTTLVMPVALD